jgi:hypothetical protein
MNNSRNNSNAMSSVSGWLFQTVIFIVGLIALYYLYQYLFSSSVPQVYPLISKIQDATIPIPQIQSPDLPVLYEGGEFTVSSWIYVASWSFLNSPLLGATPDTAAAVTGTPAAPSLVIMDIVDSNTKLSTSHKYPFSISIGPVQPKIYIKFNASTSDMNQQNTCELPEIDLQKWVNITVAVNGKAVDCYLDGKLVRSCVLQESFKIGSSYSAELLKDNRLKGRIGVNNMYDIALNPEQVYRNYMKGPEGVQDFVSWLQSSFLSLF